MSGTSRYNQSTNKYLVIGFIMVIGLWFFFSDRRIGDRFLLYIIVFSSILLSIHLYTGGSASIASVVSSTMKMVLAYLVIKTVGEQFVETYVKLLVFLALFGLFGYATDMLHLFEGIVRKLPMVGDTGYEGILYLYRNPHHLDRNHSIFYEPGAYQGFLNSAMFILFFTTTSFSNKKKYIYIAVLATALVTTFSTTGLLIFALMLALFFYRSELISPADKIKIVSIIIVIISIFSSQFYSTVVVKVNEYLNANEYAQDSSAKIRSSHAKTDLKIFKKHVFGVGHEEYKKEFGIIGRFNVTTANTSSNGVTKTLAVYGLPYSLFIFGSYFWAMKKMLHEFLLSAVAFGMFIMFLAGESYYMSAPITFSLVAAAFVYKPAPLQT